jgi:molybdate transport system substrate-binding protein
MSETMTIEGLRAWLPGSISTFVVAMILANTPLLSAETITVLSSNGYKAVLRELGPQFEKASGHEIVISYSVSAELKKRIESGEPFDLVIVTPAQIDDLIASGRVVANSRAPLARAGMALAIRKGAAKPDLHTVDALKAALIASRSIAFAKEGAGGVFFTSLVRRLGLVEQVTPKFKPTMTGDEVSQSVARGDAELGVLPLSEILPVPGVEVAGRFPDAVQDYAVMVGGIGAAAAHAASARALIHFLISPIALPVIEKTGMEVVK